MIIDNLQEVLGVLQDQGYQAVRLEAHTPDHLEYRHEGRKRNAHFDRKPNGKWFLRMW